MCRGCRSENKLKEKQIKSKYNLIIKAKLESYFSYLQLKNKNFVVCIKSYYLEINELR